MDLGLNLAPSNRDLKDPTSCQNFGDTSGLLCKNDPILRPMSIIIIINVKRQRQLSSLLSSKGKDDGPMREETRQRKRAFDFLKVGLANLIL